MLVSIAGYALPWDRPAFVDGLEETCAPGAVSADSKHNVTLLFGTHEEGRPVYAQTRDRSLSLFSDDYGLAFSARLDDDLRHVPGALHAIGRGEVAQCSVNFKDMRRRSDGRVIWAQISHIALVATGNAAYRDTGVWLRDQASDPWLAEMRECHRATTRARALQLIAEGRAERQLEASLSATARTPFAGRARPPQSVLNGIDAIIARAGEFGGKLRVARR